MKNEFLIGSGSATRKVRKLSRANEKAAPAPVDMRFIGVLVVLGMIFIGLGYLRVHAVFSLRDDEMETRRLQELAQQRRDRYKSMTSRLAQLRRTEVLRTAAEGTLGMAIPEPQAMETLTIGAETNDRWLAAAGISPASDPAKKEVN
ncbi:MAG TPA: hypothetical protein PKH51_00735 [Candidatus Sumerlaeota bacterium]|nr:hypothetical protein [Candidatus Sumerlaeota bacterium]HMZ51607.1 hypothetical protein [Candidatus Sumerlaeota bacterium]HNM45523.1 hypothetical protein [Candidatus Sumerlaeota bacterium]